MAKSDYDDLLMGTGDPRFDDLGVTARERALQRYSRPASDIAQIDLLGIELTVLAGESVSFRFPERRNYFKLLRLLLPDVPSCILVSLTMGRRSFDLIPAPRFHQPFDVGWAVEIGEKLELTFQNAGSSDLWISGCIDYQHLVPARHDRMGRAL